MPMFLGNVSVSAPFLISPPMDFVTQPELTPTLISTIKEALACGLFGVVISAWYVKPNPFWLW